MNIINRVKALLSEKVAPGTIIYPEIEALRYLIAEQKDLINTLVVKNEALESLNKTLSDENERMENKVDSAIVFLRPYCTCNNNLCAACRVIDGALK